jgi:hypothetical protein
MSYFDLSLDAANRAYTWGWRLSLAAAVSTALGVLLLTWVAKVREHDFEEQVANLHSRATMSEERAVLLEREAERLRLEFQNRDAERQAAAAASAAMATVAIERREPVPANRAPDNPRLASRHISEEQRTALLEHLERVTSHVVLRFEPNQEAAEYAVTIRDILIKAGVPVEFGSAASPSGLTGIRVAMIMSPGEGEALPAARQMSSILQDSGLLLERPIHWRSFPLSADEDPLSRSRSVRPAEVLIFVGAKPPAK